ncbi:hypothetical protein BDR03DRAFT_236552 [Suillus americanus]|nr:hypothetical protein BDR03DRAFT_236552 [Suillus americanus]
MVLCRAGKWRSAIRSSSSGPGQPGTNLGQPFSSPTFATLTLALTICRRRCIHYRRASGKEVVNEPWVNEL